MQLLATCCCYWSRIAKLSATCCYCWNKKQNCQQTVVVEKENLQQFLEQSNLLLFLIQKSKIISNFLLLLKEKFNIISNLLLLLEQKRKINNFPLLLKQKGNLIVHITNTFDFLIHVLLSINKKAKVFIVI